MNEALGQWLAGFITVAGIHAIAFLCCLIAKVLIP